MPFRLRAEIRAEYSNRFAKGSRTWLWPRFRPCAGEIAWGWEFLPAEDDVDPVKYEIDLSGRQVTDAVAQAISVNGQDLRRIRD